MAKALLIGAIGLVLSGGGVYSLSKAWESRSWKQTTATIKTVRVVSERQDQVTDKDFLNKDFDHTLFAVYTYTVNGVNYTSDERKLKNTTSRNSSESFDISQGDPISISYNPDDPGESTHDKASFFSRGLVSLIIGLLTLFAAFLFSKD